MVRRLSTALAVISTVMLTMTACNGGTAPDPSPSSLSTATGGPDPSSPTSTMPHDPPSYPNTRPGERPPIRPLDVLSDEGAEAFAVYFIKTLDWAYATMDTTLLRDASASSCDLCRAFIDEFAARNSKGEWIRGSRSSIVDVVPAGSVDPSNKLVNVIFDVSALQLLGDGGEVLGTGEAINLFQMNVRVAFSSGRWATVDATQVVPQ